MAKKNETVPTDSPEQLRPQGGDIEGTEEHEDRLELQPNDLILVHCADSAVEEQVIRMNRGFRAQGIPNLVLVVPDGTGIEQLDEQQMNRAGWYRGESE